MSELKRDLGVWGAASIVVGTVIGAKVFARAGAEKDSRSLQIEEQEVAKMRKDETDRVNIIKDSAVRKIERISGGDVLAADVNSKDGSEVVPREGPVVDGTAHK